MWAANPNIKPDTHDLALATSLLAQAAGRRAGRNLAKEWDQAQLVLVTNPSNVTRRNAAVQIQAMLRQAGIDVNVKSYPADVLFAPAGEGGVLQLGNFDLSLAGWYAGVDPDESTQLMKAIGRRADTTTRDTTTQRWSQRKRSRSPATIARRAGKRITESKSCSIKTCR